MTSWYAHFPALQVIVPMLTAPLVVLFRARGLAWLAATATSMVAFAIAITMTGVVLNGSVSRYEMGAWPAPYGIELSVDAFSALVLLLITGASTFALLAGRISIDREIDPSRQPLFYSAWLLTLAGLAGIVVSADAFNVFVFMEIASLASYVLIAGGPDRRALPAVFKYLIMGTIGATFYLIGIGLIYLMTGTLNLADMELRIHEVADQKPILAAAGFITVGLALKAAVFPLHLWLPNAYRYAPNIVTVFLAACATKVSLYVLLRFDFSVFQPNLVNHNLQFSYFMMPLAMLAVLVASGSALFEKNIKRLLAYSSVAEVGYILLGASLVSINGLTAGIIHMFNHSLAKGALFLSVACLGVRFSGLQLADIAGAARSMPWTMAAFVLAGLSLIGIPGTAGFITKWFLITAALEAGGLGIAVIGVVALGSLVSAAYIWRVVEAAYFGAPGSAVAQPREAPILLLAVTGVIAIANVYFGLAPGVPIALSSSAAEMLLEHVP